MSVCKHRVMDRCKKDDRPCIFSPDCFEPEEEKPMTNAQRIRAMSDEELVEFIKNIKVRAAFCKAVRDNDAFEELCSGAWLQQPAGGGCQ